MKPVFSITKCAVAAVGFTKANPKFVLRFFGFHVGFIVFCALALWLASMGKFFYNAPEVDPSLREGLTFLLPLIGFGLVFGVTFFVATSTMLFRKILFNQEIGFHGLSWGDDEWRLLKAQIIIIGPVLVVVGLLAALFSFAKSAEIFGYLGGTMAVFAIPMLIYYSLRTVQYNTVVMATKAVNFDQIWKETEGNVWAFFFMGFLCGILTAIVQAVFDVILRLISSDAALPSAANSAALGAVAILWVFFTILFLAALIAIQSLIYITAYSQAYLDMRNVAVIESP